MRIMEQRAILPRKTPTFIYLIKINSMEILLHILSPVHGEERK